MNKRVFLIVGIISGITLGYILYAFVIIFMEYDVMKNNNESKNITNELKNEVTNDFKIYVLSENVEKYEEVNVENLIEISKVDNSSFRLKNDILEVQDSILKYSKNNEKIYYLKSLNKNTILSLNDIGTHDKILDELTQSKYLNDKKIIKIRYDEIYEVYDDVKKQLQFKNVLEDLTNKYRKYVNLKFLNFENKSIIQTFEKVEMMFIDKDNLWINCDLLVANEIEKLEKVSKIVVESERLNE